MPTAYKMPVSILSREEYISVRFQHGFQFVNSFCLA